MSLCKLCALYIFMSVSSCHPETNKLLNTSLCLLPYLTIPSAKLFREVSWLKSSFSLRLKTGHLRCRKKYIKQEIWSHVGVISGFRNFVQPHLFPQLLFRRLVSGSNSPFTVYLSTASALRSELEHLFSSCKPFSREFECGKLCLDN